MKHEVVQSADAATNGLAGLEIGSNIVYLMGASFVLGSLFTIFILILLDFMQRDRIAK